MGFWDSAFSAPGYKYGEAPNAFLASQEPHFTRGSRVLVPGDGEGRNGVWLAERGHIVATIDASQVGVEKARTLAAARGVSLDIQLGDLELFVPEPASVDVVASIYLHLPAPLRRRVHQRLLTALAPGGWFVLEAFHPRQLGRASGGPKDVAMLYTSADIIGDIAAVGTEQYEIIEATETETTLDEGPGHRGPAVVTRIVARRLAQ
jgi:SAM-dependent methyltransferase